MAGSTPLTLFVGAPVGHNSERRLLGALIERLQASGEPAVVFANIHLPGHQIDAVVATPGDVCVVEAKTSHLPVKGDLNGRWARQDAAGVWRDYPNGYQQALSAKHALKDAFAAWCGSAPPYPSGQVVFVPGPPAGSALTVGDFKVAVTDLATFLAALPAQPGSRWSLADWVGFAKHLGLRAVTADQLLFSPTLQSRDAVLERYGAAFVAQYEGPASRWLPEDDHQIDALINAAAGAGVHIAGPSGCGKTLMAHRLAVTLARQGSPTVYLAGKSLTGHWRADIRRELGLLVDESADVLMAAFKTAPAAPVLVIDGLNEVAGDRNDALRAILALARRYAAKLVITDQRPPGEAFAGLTPFAVTEPSQDLKRRIAGCDGSAPANVQQALDVARSGLEAEVIGQVRSELPAGVSRLHLLERFARARLKQRARAASLGLRRLAARLHANVAFSLPEVAFDDLMAAHGVSATDADAMFDARLVVRRGHRVSFAHEMFQNMFAAFDWAATAAADPKALAQQLSTPRLRPLAPDVLAAIDDVEALRGVLDASDNADLIAAAAEGDCGPTARLVARELLKQSARACAAEIDGAVLVLEPREHVPVDWDPARLRAWTAPEIARFEAIGETSRSTSFDLYMRLCAAMDARLDDEWRRLLPEARRLKVGLRSAAFGLAYYKFGSDIGFSHANPNSIRASYSRRRRVQVVDLPTLTSGQLHFVLDNRYSFFSKADAEHVAEFLIEALQTRYPREPYHVRLELLTAAGFVRDVHPETVARLVSAIESLDTTSNWGLNSAIIDALKFLGAIDGDADGQRELIRDEVRAAVSGEATDARCEAALSVYVKQFDHPYDSLYGEEVDGLGPDGQLTLYRRALSAPGVARSISLTWLVQTILKLEDPDDGPLLQRFACPPKPDEVFAQDQWAAFALVTRFLGRKGLPLPAAEDDTPSGQCLRAIQVLLHGHECRRDADVNTAAAAWATLNQGEVGLTIGCLSEMQAAISDGNRLEDHPTYPKFDLVDAYPTECLALARRFFDEQANAAYHHVGQYRATGGIFALSCIGKAGDRTDAPRLKALSLAGPLAPAALAVLRALDGAQIS